MKASDSTNSLTGLTEHVEIQMEENACFICLDELNDRQEPLVDSSLLRTCGCRFKVHPVCWNEWMRGKSDYDCPICRKKSLSTGKPPTPPQPPSDWPSEERPCCKRPFLLLVFIIVVAGASIMAYEIANS